MAIAIGQNKYPFIVAALLKGHNSNSRVSFKSLSNPSFIPLSWPGLLFRLTIALIIGLIVGLERETKDKPAGLRTNMLVAFSATLAILISIQTGTAQENPNVLGRVISSILTGVGFIGAGTIIRDDQVKGLTSAATIWVSAVLGIAVGCGLWGLGLLGAMISWIILRVLNYWENFL